MTTPPSSPQPHSGFGSGSELWLARHGEVHADWQGQEYGALDVPLGEPGRLQSERLAAALARLEPAVILSSHLQRAEHMGRALALAAGLELQVDPRLGEIDRGGWSGRRVEELHGELAHEVRAFYADPWSWRGHGGENDAMLAERIWLPIEAGLKQAAGARLVVTSHYNVVRVLVSTALGIPPASSFNLRLDAAHLVVLKDGPGGWELLYSNLHEPPAGMYIH